MRPSVRALLDYLAELLVADHIKREAPEPADLTDTPNGCIVEPPEKRDDHAESSPVRPLLDGQPAPHVD
jgi:hypothetical protein